MTNFQQSHAYEYELKLAALKHKSICHHVSARAFQGILRCVSVLQSVAKTQPKSPGVILPVDINTASTLAASLLRGGANPASRRRRCIINSGNAREEADNRGGRSGRSRHGRFSSRNGARERASARLERGCGTLKKFTAGGHVSGKMTQPAVVEPLRG